MIVSIIGGTRGFGLWTGKFIKEKFPSVEIIITGRNKIYGEKIAKDNNLKFTTDNIKAVKQADIVIFSVPISKMEQTIREIGPYIKQNAIVLDVCSIKSFPSKAMKKYCKNAKCIIPTHPMFGPYINDIAGQIFVLTPDEEYKKFGEYKLLKNYLKKSGAKVIETNPEYHDKIMAVVQGLTHINMFTIGETIRRLGVPVQESLDFVSPIYKLMIASVARYVGHDPRLYGDIQMYNPEVINVHKIFMEVIKDFSMVVETKDEDRFVNLIEETKKHFGEETTKFGQEYTDKIIYLMTKQIEKVIENIGKDIEVKNIYTNKVSKLKIKSYEDGFIIGENGEKLSLNKYLVL